MAAIAKPDAPVQNANQSAAHTHHAWQALFDALCNALQQRGAHPARCVVLLPYAQLMPVAKAQWLRHPAAQALGFVPRFESTMNWATACAAGMHSAPSELDIRFDTACDLLTAERWLRQAGLAAQQSELAPALLEAAWQLAPVVAAQPPLERASWGRLARSSLLAEAPWAEPQAGAPQATSGQLRFEAAVAQIALEWALASAYASDLLFAPATLSSVDCLVQVRGLQTDALAETLLAHYGSKAFVLDHLCEHLPAPVPLAPPVLPHLALHACEGAHDEAQRSAACVLLHLHAGRVPIALVANDRSLVRRVRAELAAQGVALRDETGWALSTTHAAAALMALLRALSYLASSDAVLDAAKQCPCFSGHAVDSLEAELRSLGTTDWRAYTATHLIAIDMAQTLNQWRASCSATRPLSDWLSQLRTLLQASGQWPQLQADAAGAQLLQALYLEESEDKRDVGGDSNGKKDSKSRAAELPASPLRWSLTEFTRWVSAVLEAASFKPAAPAQAQVVILPLAQLLGRPFAAVVVPGCDEQQLAVAPEPAGLWSALQRQALGLPQRAELQSAASAAWNYLLRYAAPSQPGTTPPGSPPASPSAQAAARPSSVTASPSPPCVDALWRSQHAGEALMPSGFVQSLRLRGAPLASEPRLLRSLPSKPTMPPQPRADDLLRETLSASAYADLRACPYRYFGLRSLGLAEADELDAALDKRDFGNWLHLVLKRFHEALAAKDKSAKTPADTAYEAIINRAAEEATQLLGLDAAAFTPFAAAWPRVRAGYLAWWALHQASGAQFAQAEVWREQPMGRVTLVGKIDRIDRLPAVHGRGEHPAQRLVIDYKTEAPSATKKRLAEPLDDTQLAFYAALLEDDELQAAYVNVGEKDGTHSHPMHGIVELRNALVDGILHDMDRIAAGQALPALGEGSACTYCAARGLCRRDFWSAT